MATIREISDRAGVSIATVSKVLNNKSGVKQETADRILQIADQLNYRPNLNARSLKLGDARTIGIITEEVLAATKNTAFMYMEEGIRCNAVSPGGVVTDIPLVMPPSDEFGFSRTSKLLDFSGELAMPEDLADAILFLASDQSRYVNGEELKCDGGWTCF